YKMRHTCYGNISGRFAGAGWRLFLRGLPLWLVIFLPFAAGLVALGLAYDPDTVRLILRKAGDDDVIATIATIDPDLFDAMGFAVITTGTAAVLAALLYPLFQSIQLRWWLSGLRLGRLAMRSHLRTACVYAAYLRFVAYLLLFIVVLALAA